VRRHLSTAEWLRHPWRSSTATSLARRGGGGGPAEAAHGSLAESAANRVFGRRGRRVLRWSGKAQRAALAAELRCADVVAAEDRDRVVGGKRATAWSGWSTTARAARGELAAARAAIRADRERGVAIHDHARGRAATVLAHLLLLVDAVALLVVFGLLLNLDWADPGVPELGTACAFALFGAGVQAKLAVVVGERIWVWRVASAHPDTEHDPAEEFPPRGPVLVLLCLLLGLIGAGAAASIFLRIRYEGQLVDQVGVASVVGLVLAGCAVAAPWVLVLQHAFDGSPTTRLVAGLTAVVHRADVERARGLRRADRAIADARSIDARMRRERARIDLRVERHLLRAHRTVLLARSCAGNGQVVAKQAHPACPMLDTALEQSAGALVQAQAIREAVAGTGGPADERFGREEALVRREW